MEVISFRNMALKIKEEKYWINFKDDIKEQLKKLNKQDKVSYVIEWDVPAKRYTLVSINEIGGVGYNKPTPNKQIVDRMLQVASNYAHSISQPPKINYAGTMQKTIQEVNEMMPLISDKELRKQIDWASIINTLFIAKVGKR